MFMTGCHKTTVNPRYAVFAVENGGFYPRAGLPGECRDSMLLRCARRRGTEGGAQRFSNFFNGLNAIMAVVAGLGREPAQRAVDSPVQR
jgi:hypothetical protein